MNTTLNRIVNENELNIKVVEQEIKKYVLEMAKKMMRMVLEALDSQILAEIDPKIFINCGFKNTTINTIFGAVKYKRRLYKLKDEEEYIYLLDKVIEMDCIGKMSICLVERIIALTTEMSFEKAAECIKEEIGETFSTTALWNVTKEYANRIKEKEKAEIEKLNEGYEINSKKKKVDVLFVEADGIHVNLQGKDREKKGSTKEVKVAVFYEGWKKRYKKSKDEQTAYVTVNKSGIAGFYEEKNIDKALEVKIRKRYEIDDIDTIIYNGDGALWIKNILGDRKAYFQLDNYHVHSAITKCFSNKDTSSEIKRLLKSKDIEGAISRIEKEKYMCGGEEKQVKKYSSLQRYIRNNSEGIIPYNEREKIVLKKPPEGLVYRGLGTMEHNVCDIIKLRMKGNKTNWSIEGADNMAKLRVLKCCGELFKEENEARSLDIPERYKRIYEEVITKNEFKLSTKKIPKIHTVHHGGMPFEGAAVTNGRKAIQNMIKRMGTF